MAWKVRNYGSFPAYLSVQNGELEKHLAYLPKDRAILTVSNHAQRAGRAGDLLASKGFIVAGATGSEDYEQEGGKSVVHIQPPVARQVQSNQVLEERTKGSSISSLTMVFALTIFVAPRACMIFSTAAQASSAVEAQWTCAPLAWSFASTWGR